MKKKCNCVKDRKSVTKRNNLDCKRIFL